VYHLRAKLPVSAGENGSPVLPKSIRWAFSLNEGDLVVVAPEEEEAVRFRFHSYGERVRDAAASCSHPWSYIEEVLRLPMAALDPGGVLLLPEEAAALTQHRVPLLLRAEVSQGRRVFSLEMADRQRSPELSLEAAYTLPVLPGFRVSLPHDALWVLGIGEGDLLAFRSSLATVDFEPLTEGEHLESRSVVALEPGGSLSLPESLRADLQADARVRLTVTVSPKIALRLALWVEADVRET
jgi:hypothetical protein